VATTTTFTSFSLACICSIFIPSGSGSNGFPSITASFRMAKQSNQFFWKKVYHILSGTSCVYRDDSATLVLALWEKRF
jgi:hypothetical protein